MPLGCRLPLIVRHVYRRFNSSFSSRGQGIRLFYDTCWQFQLPRCDALLSLEDPAYLTKVFFKALGLFGIGRWLPFNVGAVARHIKDQQLLKFIDIECLLVRDACGPHADDKSRHGVF